MKLTGQLPLYVRLISSNSEIIVEKPLVKGLVVEKYGHAVQGINKYLLQWVTQNHLVTKLHANKQLVSAEYV